MVGDSHRLDSHVPPKEFSTDPLKPFALALLVAAPFAQDDDKARYHAAATKNGQVHPNEMAAMSAAEYAKLDADKDGELERSEMPAC